MKLTNYIRDAFINAVMADVPKTDFGEDDDGASYVVCFNNFEEELDKWRRCAAMKLRGRCEAAST